MVAMQKLEGIDGQAGMNAYTLGLSQHGKA